MVTRELPFVCQWADRVQINLRSNQYDWDALEALAKTMPVIQQTRDTKEWPLTPRGVSPLFDCSGGRGTEIPDYPKAAPDQLIGYAGGFRPGNVRPFIEGLHHHPHDYWIDMETGVRTNDWFDVDKCREVFG